MTQGRFPTPTDIPVENLVIVIDGSISSGVGDLSCFTTVYFCDLNLLNFSLCYMYVHIRLYPYMVAF